MSLRLVDARTVVGFALSRNATDTFDAAEDRLNRVMGIGVLPMAMLWRDVVATVHNQEQSRTALREGNWMETKTADSIGRNGCSWKQNGNYGGVVSGRVSESQKWVCLMGRREQETKRSSSRWPNVERDFRGARIWPRIERRGQ